VKISGDGSALIFSDGSVMSSATTGVGGGTITAVNTPAGSGLTGGATAGAVNLSLSTTCGVNQVLRWNGSAWACFLAGTVTSIGQGVGIVATPNPITSTGTIAIDPTVVPQLAANNNFTGATNTFVGVTGATFTSTAVGANNTFLGPVIAPSFSGPAGAAVTGPSFTSTVVGANNTFLGPVIAPSFSGPAGGPVIAPALGVAGAVGAPASMFSGNNATQVVGVTQNGAGDGLDASVIGAGTALKGISGGPGITVLGSNMSPAGPSVGVEGTAASNQGTGVIGLAGTNLPSSFSGSFGVQGISSMPNGFGVLGYNTDTTGTGAFPPDVGVDGQVAHPGGAAVYGAALSTSGTPAGVAGNTVSPLGTGVYGINAAAPVFPTTVPNGPASGEFGVQGVAVGINGTGVFGHALDTSGSGTTIGVQGIAESPTGTNIPYKGTGVQGIGGLGGIIGISPTLMAQDASLASLNPPTGTPEITLHPGVVGIGVRV